MIEFFTHILARGSLPAVACCLWNPAALWLNSSSDLVMAAAFYTIPILLFCFARRLTDLKFHWMFGAFGTFILVCGAAHLLGAGTVRHATHRLDGVVEAITAAVSIFGAALLVPLLRSRVQLPALSQTVEECQRPVMEARQRIAAAEALARQWELFDLARQAILERGSEAAIFSRNRRDGAPIIVSSLGVFRRTAHRDAVLELDAGMANDLLLFTLSHAPSIPPDVILGFAAALLIRLTGDFAADQESHLKTNQNNARRLFSLANMLELAKIESVRLELHREMVEEIVSSLRPLATKVAELAAVHVRDAGPGIRRVEQPAFLQACDGLTPGRSNGGPQAGATGLATNG